MSNINSKCSLTAMALSIISSGSSPVMAADYSPSPPHWIDDCPASTDTIDTKIDLKIKHASPCGQNGDETSVTLFGPTVIHKDVCQTFPDRHIEIEITSMVLTNDDETITFRAGKDELLFTPSSTGRITEKAGNCDDKDHKCLADNYFDIFFEIDVLTPKGSTFTLRNKDAWHKEIVIDQKRPIVMYELPEMSITTLSDQSDGNKGCLVKEDALVTCVDNSFIASASDGDLSIDIAWETATEVDNAGFFVWRGELPFVWRSQLPTGKTACSKEGNDYTEVKRISPFIMTQGAGASYSYDDNQVISGNTYCYALENVDLTGKSTFHLDDIIPASIP
ncbi:MAG: hypothetical protein KAI83_08540 [Thiomargarita sp.]|nr:hypothetical protein [Thiomargarita sp.]